MRKYKFIYGAFTLTLFVSCGKGHQAQTQEVRQAYPSLVVSKQSAILESVYPTTIKGMEDVEIKPRVEGFIDAILVDEGSVVRKGQALFKINSPQAEQVFSSAQANVLSAQAQLNTAQVNVDRIRPLAEKNIVSNTQLLTYENAYQTAFASLKQAEAALKNAQATMNWTTVTSPVDGVVGALSYRAGSLVNSSTIITTVASTDNVFAYFSLNENELRALLNGTKGNTQAEKIKNLPEVTLRLSDETLYPEKGKIETISGVVNILTGSASLRAKFPNQQAQLRSGYSGQLIISEPVEEALIVPQKATFRQQNKVLIYKVEGDSAVQTVIAIKDMPDGKNYVVTTGLSEGDRIITEGVATLNNGKKIVLE